METRTRTGLKLAPLIIAGIVILFQFLGAEKFTNPETGRTERVALSPQQEDALGLQGLQPAAIDHYDSGQLILEAAAQGLGIAIMHDDHLKRHNDPRLSLLYDADIDSPYSYWFVCRPVELETRPVRLFHDWLVEARL